MELVFVVLVIFILIGALALFLATRSIRPRSVWISFLAVLVVASIVLSAFGLRWLNHEGCEGSWEPDTGFFGYCELV
jgi:hypothetical protein